MQLHVLLIAVASSGFGAVSPAVSPEVTAPSPSEKGVYPDPAPRPCPPGPGAVLPTPPLASLVTAPRPSLKSPPPGKAPPEPCNTHERTTHVTKRVTGQATTSERRSDRET